MLKMKWSAAMEAKSHKLTLFLRLICLQFVEKRLVDLDVYLANDHIYVLIYTLYTCCLLPKPSDSFSCLQVNSGPA